MVRGAQSKNDSTEIDDLFRLTTSDWVSNEKSQDRRETILNNEWFNAGLKPATKDQHRVALRKWRRYTLQDISVGHTHQMTLVLHAFGYEAMMKTKDQAFTSLQDSDEKLCGFLDWLLDAIEVHNGNPQQKSIIAPSQQLEHAVQALSCVKKCQMGVAGQGDGWNPGSSILKGPFIRAKQMQVDIGACTGSLDSRHLTVSQYRAYLSESWTFKTSPEQALTGMFMVVEATTAVNCGLRAEDSGELRWAMLAVVEPIDNIGPATCIPLQLGLRRAGSKTSHEGKAEWFTVVEHIQPECCPVLAIACLLIQSQPNYQEVFLKGDDTFWEHRLLAKGIPNLGPVKYDMLHAQHSKIMVGARLADEKAGTGLHIFKSTGNLMLEIEGADKDKVNSWGRWVQSTKAIFYDAKSSLHNLPVQMLLAGWGSEYRKEHFLGRSTVALPSDVFDEFVNLLRPSLVPAEQKVAKMLRALDALPHKEKQWQCNQQARTRLTDMQKSVQAERRLIQVFLYGLPLLLDLYTPKNLVVVRGSTKVCELMQDQRYMDYCTLVRDAHKTSLDRIQLAKLPLEERLAAQQQAHLTETLHALVAKMQAGTDNRVTSGPCVVDEPEPKQQPAAPASPPNLQVAAAKSGLLFFKSNLETVEQAFHEWPSIEGQIEAQGGWHQLSDKSRNNYNKRRHLVQRIRLLMDVQSHGLSAEAACQVYSYVQHKGGFSLAELRNAVNHAEPVPDSRARGGKAASRKDTDVMPRDKNKTPVTKGQVLLWRSEALQAELSQVGD